MGKSTLRQSSVSISKSRLVIATLASFVLGIFLGDYFDLDIWWLAGIIIGVTFVLVIFWQKINYRAGLFILLGLIIGLGYFNFFNNHQKSIELSYDKELTIEGQIVGHPDFSGGQAKYVIKYEKTKIQVTTSRYPEFYYGDVLKLKGSIRAAYPYFFHQGILGQVSNPTEVTKIKSQGNIAIKTIYNIRDKFEESLNKSLSEPYASFAAGLVLGSKRNINDSLLNDFNRTGTTHIVAVSGYNLTIIIVYIAIFFGLFSRKAKLWGSMAAIIIFVLMTGAPASVVRAGILAGLVIFGQYEGRRINMTILLLLVGGVMLSVNPYAIKYDLSFQLSFLAFIGLIYLSSWVAALKIVRWMPVQIKNTFSETIAAQSMVLPILIYYFGQLSLISPLVNILVLPLVPLSMALVFATGLGGLLWIKIGQLVGYLGWLFLKYIIVTVESFSKIPWASLTIKAGVWWWMPLYFLIFGILVYKHNFKKTVNEEN